MNLVLDPNPDLQQQPTDCTCGPTSIAMAFGVDVKAILYLMRGLGIDTNEGLSDRDESYFLTCMGVYVQEVPIGQYNGILAGHYLVSVMSLNVMTGAHSVFVYVTDDSIAVYDPNKGLKDSKYYDDWDDLNSNILWVRRLDDFRDLKYGKD